MRAPTSWFTPVVSALMVWLVAASAAAQPPGRVNGVVRDEDEQPIKGATVTAENPNIGVSHTASTDEKGRFILLGLRPGEWVFVAGAPGYAGAGMRTNVRAASNLNQPLLFALRRNGPGAGGALEKLSSRDIQAQIENADKLIAQEKWDEAIAAYRSLASNAEPLAFLNLGVAAAYIGKNDLARAQAAYEEILKVDPTHEKAIVGVAELKQKQGDVPGAIAYLARAARVEGAGREIFFALGEMSASGQSPAEAQVWFVRASEADPYWGRPLYRLAQLATDSGDSAAADRYLERILAVDPTSAEAAQARTALGQRAAR